MRDALLCESRPHASGARVSSIIVYRNGTQTVAATGDWTLAKVMLGLALPW